MSRTKNSKALPLLDVKEKMAVRRIKLPEQLDQQLTKFADFYESATGARPDDNAVVVGLLRDYLAGMAPFQTYLKEQKKSAGAS
jgi:hypothetical protein